MNCAGSDSRAPWAAAARRGRRGIARAALAALAAAAALAPAPRAAAQWIQVLQVPRCRNSTLAIAGRGLSLDTVTPATRPGAAPQCVNDLGAGMLLPPLPAGAAGFRHYQLDANYTAVTLLSCADAACTQCTPVALLPIIDVAAAAAARNQTPPAAPECGFYSKIITNDTLLSAKNLEFSTTFGGAANATAAYAAIAAVSKSPHLCSDRLWFGRIQFIYEECAMVSPDTWFKSDFGDDNITAYACTSPGCTSGCTPVTTFFKPAPAGSLICHQESPFDMLFSTVKVLNPKSRYAIPAATDFWPHFGVMPPTAPQPPSQSSSLSTSTIAIISVACAIGIAVIVGAAFVFMRINRSRSGRRAGMAGGSDGYADGRADAYKMANRNPKASGEPLQSSSTMLRAEDTGVCDSDGADNLGDISIDGARSTSSVVPGLRPVPPPLAISGLVPGISAGGQSSLSSAGGSRSSGELRLPLSSSQSKQSLAAHTSLLGALGMPPGASTVSSIVAQPSSSTTRVPLTHESTVFTTAPADPDAPLHIISVSSTIGSSSNSGSDGAVVGSRRAPESHKALEHRANTIVEPPASFQTDPIRELQGERQAFPLREIESAHQADPIMEVLAAKKQA
ncbi:hypothetical protein HK105_205795 [Polyrhizophydium stewartii]|uniref:Uncharacterized protein n=1 Tax=Polyrhizophydium stewartii TaxID=2732419 RepID=A0ABR4N596_9FUNG